MYTASGYAINNVRSGASAVGEMKFTESGVADRWSIGIKPSADTHLYFTSGGDLTGGTDRMILDSSGNVVASGTGTFTNGIVFRQLSIIPTNSIPASDISNLITNFLEVNMTNTYNGGGRMMLWSNNVSGGIFSRKTVQTDTQL
jgi:hypothetical protein